MWSLRRFELVSVQVCLQRLKLFSYSLAGTARDTSGQSPTEFGPLRGCEEPGLVSRHSGKLLNLEIEFSRFDPEIYVFNILVSTGLQLPMTRLGVPSNASQSATALPRRTRRVRAAAPAAMRNGWTTGYCHVAKYVSE